MVSRIINSVSFRVFYSSLFLWFSRAMSCRRLLASFYMLMNIFHSSHCFCLIVIVVITTDKFLMVLKCSSWAVWEEAKISIASFSLYSPAQSLTKRFRKTFPASSCWWLRGQRDISTHERETSGAEMKEMKRKPLEYSKKSSLSSLNFVF